MWLLATGCSDVKCLCTKRTKEKYDDRKQDKRLRTDGSEKIYFAGGDRERRRRNKSSGGVLATCQDYCINDWLES
jgi:hypothetical protein